MSEKDNGGPAFPTPSVSQDQSTGATTVWQCDGGMTLRDYFAAKAMQAMCQRQDTPVGIVLIAEKSYVIADAMLEARKQ